MNLYKICYNINEVGYPIEITQAEKITNYKICRKKCRYNFQHIQIYDYDHEIYSVNGLFFLPGHGNCVIDMEFNNQDEYKYKYFENMKKLMLPLLREEKLNELL